MTKVALQFGGGKDSLACLHLLRPRWGEITVVWLNTGAAFPETIAQMKEIAAMVPHFLEVRSDVASDIQEHGWPVDVVPVAHTERGMRFTGQQGIKLRSWLECCGRNFWAPLEAKMKEHGFTTIIRGQRNDEHYKGTVRHGDVVDGVTYELPLQDWSESDVFAFLEREGVAAPAYYEMTKSSLDCWLCTAFLDAKNPQMDYLQAKHPEQHALVRRVLGEIAGATAAALAPLETAVR
jgi:phosphoadenosine phosphosulfate reductase